MDWKKIWPATLLVASVVVLQWHGMVFWVDHTGYTGILWSLLLDGMGLWLWSRREVGMRVLGVIASVMTLIGPLYQVGYPPLSQAWASYQHAQIAPQVASSEGAARAHKMQLLTDERTRLQDSLATYEANSEQRSGWLPAIESANQRLNEVNKELADLAGQVQASDVSASDASILAGNLLVVFMQLVSLLMFQVVGIICVLTLAKLRPTSSGQETPAEPAGRQKRLAVSQIGGERQEEEEKRKGSGGVSVPDMVERLNALLEQRSISQSAFARQHDLSAKELSFFRNHERRAADGQKTASAPFIERLQQILEQESVS